MITDNWARRLALTTLALGLITLPTLLPSSIAEPALGQAHAVGAPFAPAGAPGVLTLAVAPTNGTMLQASGRLTDADGAPVAGVVVHLYYDGQPFAQVTTGADGSFSQAVDSDGVDAHGPNRFAAAWAGDAKVGATQVTASLGAAPAAAATPGATPSAPPTPSLESKLEAVVEPATMKPGETVKVSGRLTGAGGQPLAGMLVNLGVDDPQGRQGSNLTATDGTWSILVAAPAGAATPKPVVFHVRFDGDPLHKPTTAQAAGVVSPASTPTPSATPTATPTPTPSTTPTATPTPSATVTPAAPGSASLGLSPWWLLAPVGFVALAAVVAAVAWQRHGRD